IVISGDVQEEAIRRALELGARSFIRKPADAGQLEQALLALGVHSPTIDPSLPAAKLDLPSVGFRDAFREVGNLAMGRAAALLALGEHDPRDEPSLPAAELDLARGGFRDAFREVANIAMGRPAELLSRVPGVFIKPPVPNVNILEVAELHMALADAQGNRKV